MIQSLPNTPVKKLKIILKIQRFSLKFFKLLRIPDYFYSKFLDFFNSIFSIFFQIFRGFFQVFFTRIKKPILFAKEIIFRDKKIVKSLETYHHFWIRFEIQKMLIYPNHHISCHFVRRFALIHAFQQKFHDF